MDLPPLTALRAFEAAARWSSLSRAGDELHVTHAAISHQIKHLETWLGRRLMQRSGRGVALTPAGIEFYRVVTGALAAIASAAANMRRTQDARSITVGCIPSIAARWLVPALPAFMAHHPEINLRIVYARAEEQFDAEALDVLITLGEDRSPGIESRLLFSRVNKPVASPFYLEKHPDLRKSGDIAKADLLHDEKVDYWLDWFRKAQIAPPRRPRGPIFQDFNMLATAVIAGHGVALCPIEVFRHEIQRGDLEVISDISTLDDQGYFIISRAGQSRAVADFINWFTAQCAAVHLSLRS